MGVIERQLVPQIDRQTADMQVKQRAEGRSLDQFARRAYEPGRGQDGSQCIEISGGQRQERLPAAGCPGHHRDAVVMWGRCEERIIVLQRDRALVLCPLRPEPLQHAGCGCRQIGQRRAQMMAETRLQLFGWQVEHDRLQVAHVRRDGAMQQRAAVPMAA